ncbi:signal peptidase I [Lachnospiraceae bacterium KM106-2]|nr:signal peptidase I [Lachnospiraceae bacterium KM106-2]
MNENDYAKTEMEQPVENKVKVKKSSIALEISLYIAILLICIFIVPKYVIQRTVVDGDSMQTTLMNNDNLMVEKVSYRFSNPSRFDVIVFYPYGKDYNEYYVKRIIGLPGETVKIQGQDIYINGKKIKESYGSTDMDTAGIAADGIKLKDDEYFVLGDNRLVSKDSRYAEVGPVKKENIAGKVLFRIWPLDKIGTIQ